MASNSADQSIAALALTADTEQVDLSDELMAFVEQRLDNADDFAVFKEMLTAPMQ